MKKHLSSLKQSLFKSKGHNNVDSFLLIEGVFSPSEAADVLLSLLNDKIKFHSVQLLHLNDSNHIDISNSKNRIQELKSAKEKITNIILNARDQGSNLKIHSTIEITETTSTA
ncbi:MULTISPECIES: hypothetical protein [Flavobacteriaceae]|uniref:hypothetical protein n=1 Tax=Flavobacteriaceae TaxID=49546 RepID=UPI001490B664|nr:MULTISPECIES: hypothetical protein [Allomuricauda]MDC6365444.1 hypothetical protein [Muricauda sp. AC10]